MRKKIKRMRVIDWEMMFARAADIVPLFFVGDAAQMTPTGRERDCGQAQ